MANIAILLSGGIGSRMGMDIPKQYIEIVDKPIIQYSLETILSCHEISSVYIGAASLWVPFVNEILNRVGTEIPVWFSEPGETRQYSIYNALLEAEKHGAQNDDIIIILDAARPLVSSDLINRCLSACNDADGVLPVIKMKDTIYQSCDGKTIHNLLNRNELYAGQAPEAFIYGKYLQIHRATSHADLLKINGSTEIAFKAGFAIKLIQGDEKNFKITTPEDLSNFENIINKAK